MRPYEYIFCFQYELDWIVLENKCLFLEEMQSYVFSFKETDMLTSQAAEPWMPTSTPSLFCEQQKILETIDPISESKSNTLDLNLGYFNVG